MRVALLCEEGTGARALQLLARSRHQVAAVLTSPGSPVWTLAQKLGLSPIAASRVREPGFAAELADVRVELLLNVHSLYIIPEAVLRVPLHGAYNLHPGPLPEYAGLNAPSWAIYNGETTHAVTLHWMDAAIDAGPIAWSQTFELSDHDTGLSVSGKCVRAGIPLIVKLVETALQDPALIPRVPQVRQRRRYLAAGPPEGGSLDWTRPAAEISRFVRAADYAPFVSPWGHPVGTLDGRRVGIARVKLTGTPAEGSPGEVREVTDAGAVVSAADELVVVERIWTEGRYTRPAVVLAD